MSKVFRLLGIFGLLALAFLLNDSQPLRNRLFPFTSQSTLNDQALKAGASDSWLAKVLENIKADEYKALKDKQGISLYNRKQNLSASIQRSSLTVESANFEWRTASFGRPGSLTLVPEVKPKYEGTRVELNRPGFKESYVNKPEGLEQVFQINQKPALGAMNAAKG
jgi:hypothetical protein